MNNVCSASHLTPCGRDYAFSHAVVKVENSASHNDCDVVNYPSFAVIKIKRSASHFERGASESHLAVVRCEIYSSLIWNAPVQLQRFILDNK